MIFQSLILDNLVSLCMKIMNSVIVVGLYYGFLTTFSVGPSYLFLLRARVMEGGTKKKVSATIGFVTGQLIMFISIYYAPLHLALGRPYTITVIALPYLLFHFFGKNHKHFLNYEYKNPNSIRNWSIQRIFFNNLLFQLLNPLILPSPILIRLVNIYMFRCNNKLLFLASNFLGWLIGHTLLMKWIELILVWIQQNYSIKSNVPFRSKSNKYIMSESRNYMSQIFIVFLFITCLYYLGRTPLPFFFTKKLSEIQEKNEIDKKRKTDVKKTSETARAKQGENIFGFEKPLVTFLFDYKRWNRPLRYIKNDRFENVVRNEISQFFFHTCKNDGKDILSFPYPPNLSTFLKMIQTKISFFTKEKISYDELSNYFSSTNEEKRKKQSNEFINRAKALDKEFSPPDLFEKQIRLCNDETKTKYLPKIYDPFLNGSCRGRIKEILLTSMKNETYKKDDIWINKIHGILFNINSNSNYRKFEQKIDTFDRNSLLTEIRFFLNLISKFSGKSVSSFKFETLYLFREHKQVKMDSKKKKRKIEFLFDAIRTDLNEKTIVNRKIYIGIKEISKKVPRWSYKLIDELEQLGGKNERENYGIRSRKAKRVVIFTNKALKANTYSARDTDKKKELALIRYSQQPDFRRDIIKGSIRAQRRKTLTCNLLQKRLHSPIFLDKIEKPSLFSLDIFEPMKNFFIFKNRMREKEKKEFKLSDYKEEKTKESEKKEEDKRKKKEKEEQRRIEIAEAWDSIIFAQVIRGFLLISQSILRKYIILPSLIITKNIVRILLFQFPEWSEDFRDWNREMYIKCTYNGIQLSEREFPKKWLTDGIQIKILFPFRLKPWHRSKVKLRSSEKKKDPMKKKKEDFCFLTIWGMEVELPFSGYPRNRLSFFDPILKELKKKMKKLKKFIFLVLKVLNERRKLFLNVSKDTVKWMIKHYRKSILFLNEKRKQLKNSLFLFRLKKKNEPSESEKISKNNTIIYKSPIPVESINWTNSSLTEKKKRDLNVKTKRIRKQIDKMRKEKKGGVLTSEINISSKKTTFYAKRLELKKKILQILQRRNARIARKSHSFFKFFMEGVYIDIFLCILSIPRINVQFFLELPPKMKNTSLYHKEANAERTDKKNQSIIHFIKIIKKFRNIRNTNSRNELSSLSQAYVFFKLSETKVINIYINIYKLKPIFEYHRKSFFLKNEIKNSFFGVHGIFHSKLRHKNPSDSVINQWTNWLRLKGHSQYDLSQSRWARLVPQKWRNRINEHGVAQNKGFKKCDLYEKIQLILYKKDKKQQIDSLKKKKVKKQYGYDLLSYKSFYYADKKDSYISRYRSPFQANQKQAISYNYNTRKQNFFDITGNNISITNYIAEANIIEKNLDRKFFDWTGMNVEIPNRSISNLEFLFFSKFVIFYNAYTNNPWIIPIKLLFFNFNVNKDVSENKNITGKKKRIDIFPSKKKSIELELEIRNQAKAEYAGQVNPESSLSNEEKDIEEDSAGSDGTREKDKGIKKKKYKNKIEAELSFLLRKYSGFQLNWKGSLNQRIMSNIKVYCLLIRLKNLKEITISSIQRGELSLDIMVIQNQKDFTLPEMGKNKELLKKGILIIEPIRLSRKKDEQFLMYQTIVPSLIHKSKPQINQRYPPKNHVNVNKKNFDKSITGARDQKITEKKERIHYDYDLLVPENILSAKRRRELRILNCFNPRNRNSVYINTTFYNENKVNNCCQVLAKNKNLDTEKKKLMNFKFFLWPNYRLEDLACMNRYWFDTNNGSRFSIVRIHMYPRLKLRQSTFFFCSI
uniref:Hypothetical chloroplast RF1 n=1 Tax=Tabaroa caatingicola TaxID=707638 RepID=A0A8E7IP84_9FABA|nr:hypothetical chloroplast RF1 [Tabaroa caatingicola]